MSGVHSLIQKQAGENRFLTLNDRSIQLQLRGVALSLIELSSGNKRAD